MLFHHLIPQCIFLSLLVFAFAGGSIASEQTATAPERSATEQVFTSVTDVDAADQPAEVNGAQQSTTEDEQQANFAKAIAEGIVLNQMSQEQVIEARGEPNQKEVIPPDAELWRYAEGEVAFSAGKVTYVSLAPKVQKVPLPPQRPGQPAPEVSQQRTLERETLSTRRVTEQAPAPSSHDQPMRVSAPPITVGDTYVYESKPLGEDAGPGSRLVTRRTVTNSGSIVILSSLVLNSKNAKPRTLYYDHQWNLVKSRNTSGSGRDYSPALRYYDFPLYPGKTWNETTTERDIDTGAIRQHVFSARVKNWEMISVPAGTFRGIKVELQTELFDYSTGERVIGSDTSWYVPEVRRSVKSLITGKAGRQQLIQLLSYELSGQANVSNRVRN